MRLIDADKLSLEVADKYWAKVILEGIREHNPYAIGNEIIELIREQPTVQQWHKLTFRPWSELVEILPDFGEEVLVTDGVNVWIDSFDIDDYLYLSGTNRDIDGVGAWMELPVPYKEE